MLPREIRQLEMLIDKGVLKKYSKVTPGDALNNQLPNFT